MTFTTMPTTIRFGGERLRLVTTTFVSGNFALLAVCLDGEPYARLSVNLPESDALPPDVFYLKDWSENAPLADHLIRNRRLRIAKDYRPAIAGWEIAYPYRLAR